MQLFGTKKTPKVDEIVGVFTKTIDELTELANMNDLEAASITDEIIELEKAQDDAKQEAKRARDVANKLRGIVQ